MNPKWSNNPSDPPYYPSYNQAPGSFSPVLLIEKQDGEKPEEAIIRPMLWGLIPSFVKGTEMKGYATSNARIESLLQKPLYAQSMRQGWRCVVVAQGFYEWKTIDCKKQPYFIYLNGMCVFSRFKIVRIDPNKMLMMAGVYSYNQAKQIFSYSVITADAKGIMTEVHHRMPVVLSTDEDVYAWLDTESIRAEKAYNFLIHVAASLDKAPLCMHKVTPRMNSTRYNEPDCVLPIEDSQYTKQSVKKEGNSTMLMTFLKRPKQTEDDLSEPAGKKRGDQEDEESKRSNIKKKKPLESFFKSEEQ
ncbi:Embryonic stem cell-specific 5-hydroxymethylcytosine-binding protein [Fasciola gigantica]|uniref:Abasic site processing protein HMCES n=1 Tax=Fasciola gigantica TaxID=46835 RepID=A0A504Z4M3_FASGI|nr:Embryonic stem cell-specific 5-hydroxymethylcytosine-binding protein [Fasciola gigantica]